MVEKSPLLSPHLSKHHYIDDLRNKVSIIESMTGEISYQASHDMLTGLINRREFEARLEKAITDIKHSNKHHVLCYMDLDESGISPRSVFFEITETAIVSNFFAAGKFLQALKGMGCSFSLDDFGSGLSSFGYLKRLPVDYLKIDGSFMKSMLDDEKDFSIVKSINQIGKEMGMKTIAEFVENEALHAKLVDMGVDFSQGYGIAKPVPLSSLI